MHMEIPVKVNAWVDEGVAPLVVALNQFDCLVTLDSCQGDEHRPAYVFFKYRGAPGEVLAFINGLAEALHKRAASEFDYTLRLEWIADNPEPMVEILTSPAYVCRLSEVLKSLIKETV